MKRMIVYVLLLAVTLAIPVDKADVAKLRPIEVIYVSQEGGVVILQTDTDDVGAGSDVASALKKMKETSPALIYLDTAQYLIIGPGGEKAANDLRKILKRSVRLCKTEDSVDLKEAAAYLPVHGKLPSFSRWQPGTSLPELRLENGRLKIIKK